MVRRCSLFALSCLIVASCAAQSPSYEKPEAKVDAIFAKMDTTVSPGCALSVIRDHRIVYERGYGMADLDHNVPITPASVFHVASMSKQFTAASILLLAQEGKLSLDDPARKYVPELPDFGTPVTIRELLHHTSGLRDQWDLLGLSGWRYSQDLITDGDVLYVVSHQKELNFAPDSKFSYSNTGYTVLAQIVSRVSGQSLREFTAARIFVPLGMKNTHFRDDHAELVKNMAYGYAPAKETFRLSVTNFDTGGATSLLTTAEDLAQWDENFYNPRVRGPSLVHDLQVQGHLNSGELIDYAAGLVIGKYRGLVTVDHGGADAGYRADLLRFPDQHFSVACLCNLSTANPSDLYRLWHRRRRAELLVGGLGASAGLDGGYFVQPTVFTNVRNDMGIAQEEIFGPVLSVISYETEEEAVAIANDTVYGLAAYVSSTDLVRANRIASQIVAGWALINKATHDEPRAPFGGFKQSGMGRDSGIFAIEEFVEPKALLGYDGR